MRADKTNGDIEIRLRKVAQLLDTLDPSPFREGRLAIGAEEYILGKVKDLPKNQPIRIVVYVPADEAARYPSSEISAVITSHFAYCTIAESKWIRELFRTGRRALLIGFATLSVCLFMAWHVSLNLPARPLTRILHESFVILGWVSMWKPVDIFLYEWLPLFRRRTLFNRLSVAEVVVRSSPANAS
jgi:hypothetical protein